MDKSKQIDPKRIDGRIKANNNDWNKRKRSKVLRRKFLTQEANTDGFNKRISINITKEIDDLLDFYSDALEVERSAILNEAVKIGLAQSIRNWYLDTIEYRKLVNEKYAKQLPIPDDKGFSEEGIIKKLRKAITDKDKPTFLMHGYLMHAGGWINNDYRHPDAPEGTETKPMKDKVIKPKKRRRKASK